MQSDISCDISCWVTLQVLTKQQQLTFHHIVNLVDHGQGVVIKQTMTNTFRKGSGVNTKSIHSYEG